ncbi:MAG: hypothetical protein A2W23_09425 [Planctomycetes bacterium RBG_16_43_13]|nr:MAG: hypothetical protein A2W23_09425 [Planctomycetes bacterium RBG_16_43_13]
MGSYKIEWNVSTEKDFRRINPTDIPRIIKIANALSYNPFPPKCRKIEGSESLYRVRVGDYRIIYQVDRTRCIITIHYVRHRKDAYRGLS